MAAQQRIRAARYHHGLPRHSDLDLLTAAGRDWLTEFCVSAAAREQITIALRMIGALGPRSRRPTSSHAATRAARPAVGR